MFTLMMLLLSLLLLLLVLLFLAAGAAIAFGSGVVNVSYDGVVPSNLLLLLFCTLD